MQHVQQLNEERHFVNRTAFNQGQNVFALLQADEVIGVFATSGDPLEVEQTAEPIRCKKGFQLGTSQLRENRHG